MLYFQNKNEFSIKVSSEKGLKPSEINLTNGNILSSDLLHWYAYITQ